MNQYLINVPRYFFGQEQFVVEANTKVEALEAAKTHPKIRSHSGGNLQIDKMCVVKKSIRKNKPKGKII